MVASRHFPTELHRAPNEMKGVENQEPAFDAFLRWQLSHLRICERKKLRVLCVSEPGGNARPANGQQRDDERMIVMERGDTNNGQMGDPASEGERQYLAEEAPVRARLLQPRAVRGKSSEQYLHFFFTCTGFSRLFFARVLEPGD